jgi:hypothetical protein
MVVFVELRFLPQVRQVASPALAFDVAIVLRPVEKLLKSENAYCGRLCFEY